MDYHLRRRASIWTASAVLLFCLTNVCPAAKRLFVHTPFPHELSAQEAPASPAPTDAAPTAEAAAPSQPAPAPGTVTNVFMDTDLRQALADVAAQTGATIIPDEAVRGTISIELKEVPLKKALDLMLAVGGFLAEEIEPNVYLVVSSDPKTPGFQRIAKSEIVELDYAKGEDIQALLPDPFAQYCKYDKAGNCMVVTAPDALRRQCIEQIRALDVPPLQLLIEALVVETSVEALRDFELSLQGKHVGLSSGGGILSYVGEAENILHQLTWMAQKGLAQIRANPRVVAQEGNESKVSVSIEQYFQVINPGVYYSYANLEQIDATISLTITPRVARKDRKITCVIKPEVGDVTGTGPNELPIITRRHVETTVRVSDGQVIVIGGLLQEVRRESRTKVPILGDLPVIGHLFRSSHVANTQRETIIFVVPHILDESGRYEGPSLFEALPANNREVPKAGSAAPVPEKPKGEE